MDPFKGTLREPLKQPIKNPIDPFKGTLKEPLKEPLMDPFKGTLKEPLNTNNPQKPR